MEKASEYFKDALQRQAVNQAGIPLDPEKHNLLGGLHALATQVEELQAKQKRIESMIQQLSTRIR